MAQTSPPKGRFVWHELLTTDPDASIDFYGKVIGWKSEAIGGDPNNYRLWTMPGQDAATAGLLKMPPDAGSAPPSWLMYVAVPNVDATAGETRALGGTVYKEGTDIPGYGRFAVLADPQGAAFAVFTPSVPGAGSDEAGVGDFSWHELAADDWKAAWTFYAKLFGWEEASSMDMGPLGTYFMFKRGGGAIPLGGMFTKGPEMPWPANWTSYIRVKNVKRVAELTQKHGGKIVNGPMEVPGGDWIVQCMDPAGAMFAAHAVAADLALPAAKQAPAKKPAAKQAPAKKAAKQAVKTPVKQAAKKAARKAKPTAKKKPAAKKAAARKVAAKKPAAKKRAAGKKATKGPKKRRR